MSISLCLAITSTVLLILAGRGEHNYCTHYFYRTSAGSVTNKDYYYRDSRDIGAILESARMQIKYQLSKYNFSLSGARLLEDLVTEAGGRPLQSLIISTWRSGTTFLGELLNAIPGTYYHYEPLLKYGIIQIRGPPESDEALRLMKAMFKCNYSGLHDYFMFGSNHTYQFKHNTRLWKYCQFNKYLCNDAEFTSQLCKLFPFHTMKIVRLRLRFIQEIFDDKELNVKVILLIRDPRGVMHSRQHRDFCQSSTDCWEPSLVCADMISDYLAALRILREYPHRLMLLRYEDLALNPKLTSNSILKFLKIRPTPLIDEFIKLHTNVGSTDVLNTFRVSHEVPFKWKYTLDFNDVDEIQAACKEAMLLWGYKEAHNKTHMISEDFNPIENLPIIRT